MLHSINKQFTNVLAPIRVRSALESSATITKEELALLSDTWLQVENIRHEFEKLALPMGLHIPTMREHLTMYPQVGKGENQEEYREEG